MSEKEPISKISFNLPQSIIDYLDNEAKKELPELNRTQMLIKIITEYQKMRELRGLELLKEMARLNLRKSDHYNDQLIQEPLQILFRNLKRVFISGNLEDRFALASYEIRKFLVGENFDLSEPENIEIFDKITRFVDFFKNFAKEIYNSNYSNLLHDKEKILSSYTICVNKVILSKSRAGQLEL